jgi:hypothetical protein
MGRSALLSSSLPFSAGCENHRYLQREKHTYKASDSFSPFFFIYSLLSSPFGFLFFPSAGGGRL